MSWVQQKFDDCRKCVFFPGNHKNQQQSAPVCRECDSGEFFEERLTELRPERLRLKSRQTETPNEDENVSDE